MTVAITGDARQYAACLMMLAGLQASTRRPIPALGVVSASGLGDRVVRILALCQVASPRPWRAVAATGCAALLTFAWAIGGFAFVELVPAGRRVPALPAETLEDHRGVVEGLAPVAPQPRPAPRARRRASAGRPSDHGLEGAPSGRTAVGARAELRQAPQSAARPVEPAPRRPYPPVAPLEALPVGDPGPASLDPVGPPVPGSLVPIPASSSRPAPWAVAADGGVAIGRGSRRAAVATAGFFNRFANRVAGAF